MSHCLAHIVVYRRVNRVLLVVRSGPITLKKITTSLTIRSVMIYIHSHIIFIIDISITINH